MENKGLVVIALGGNAIKQANEEGTAEEQFRNVEITCDQLVKVNEAGYKILLTHGNGPQAGNLLIQQEEATDQVPAQPLAVVGAMTQGQIGFMFQNTLRNFFLQKGKNVPVTTILTQVVVDPKDPDFQDPSKPVGPFYTEAEAKVLEETKNYQIKKVKPTGDRVYRRVVPSPAPIGIVELESVKALLDSKVVVVASGGGGIPVMQKEDGTVESLAAVIDKDLAGNLLAQEVDADTFMVLTDVENACIHFGTDKQEGVGKVTLAEMQKLYDDGHFLKGSMGPKVQAAMKFVQSTGKTAIITSMFKAADALQGKAGTIITA